MSVASDAADVLVVCGPTAAGKSVIAMWLASERPVTIISADSRQVYRGFDIGTAKPSTRDRERVPHRGVDVADPIERYSAARWAEAAATWIADARGEGRLPIVVGGTGLYLRALFDGLFEEPPLDAEQRKAVGHVLDAMPITELRRWAMALDPARAHLGRTQLIRAIEIALLTGRRVSDLHRAHARQPVWRPRYLLVDPGPALAGFIAARIDDMLDHGWPDEVARLMTTVPSDAAGWNAAGYVAVRDFVRGSVSRDAAIEQILITTRQYAKRQRTWFRHQLPGTHVTRVNPLDLDWREHVARWSTSTA